jgi:murein DD-endopeptidase MepM/ murein hydrolase activator NlpD
VTVSKKTTQSALAVLFLLVVGLFTHPATAQSTKERLEAAQARVEELRAEANIATAAYERAHERLIVTQEKIEVTEAALAEARAKIGKLQGSLDERARAAYTLGPTSTIHLLLEAETVTEFSDRLEFLDRLAQDDADLATRVAVISEELRRQEAELERLERIQAAAEAEAEKQKEIVYSKLQQAEELEAQLEEQYREELAAARAAAAAAAAAAAEEAASAPSGGGGGSAAGSIATVSGQALQACPAPGTSFVDSFGAPRSGGRTHQGVDMMGNYGMPIYAAQSGTVSHSSSSLGGNQAYVHSSSGYTFYAHLQGYSGASGSVSAGTLIGYMGDTGNATGVPHLHFEYHPGGGAAVNPTPYVAAVC